MTRKHFEGVAKVMRDSRPTVEDQISHSGILAWKRTMHELCNYFKTVNPNFDSERFIAACYS